MIRRRQQCGSRLPKNHPENKYYPRAPPSLFMSILFPFFYIVYMRHVWHMRSQFIRDRNIEFACEPHRGSMNPREVDWLSLRFLGGLDESADWTNHGVPRGVDDHRSTPIPRRDGCGNAKIPTRLSYCRIISEFRLLAKLQNTKKGPYANAPAVRRTKVTTRSPNTVAKTTDTRKEAKNM